MKTAVGISGGVDSSAAIALLKESGFSVVGITLSLCDNGKDDISDAKKVCEALEIEHKVFDMRELFGNTVIDNFVTEYERGATPNPCVVCNKEIKFGAMLNEAKKLGCEKIATGHYVRTEISGDRVLLKKAKDEAKDQSYMLYSLSQEQLKSSVFPLGDLTKAEVRDYAQSHGLITAHKSDSQDICFVPSGDYAGFIREYTRKTYPQGNFISKSGEILGRHNGIIGYTVGQRKGLGIALGTPAFVLSKNIFENTVTLGKNEDLFYRFVTVENINFIPFDSLLSDINAYVKLRYKHKEQKAILHPTESGITVEFFEPQRAPAIGQSAVFYDGSTVLGGGIISGVY